MFWPSDGSEFQSHRKLCSPWCWGRQRPRWCSWRMKIWESGRGLGYGGGQRNTGGLWMALKGKRRIPKWPGGTEEFFEMCWEEGVRDDAGGALELMVDFFFFFLEDRRGENYSHWCGKWQGKYRSTKAECGVRTGRWQLMLQRWKCADWEMLQIRTGMTKMIPKHPFQSSFELL